VEKPHTFVVLDALRGLGAFVVMQTHFARFFGIHALPHAEVAVDFFSMLSGFVLTYAYQDKLDRGWTFTSFCKTRLIRVYPIYLTGLVLGLIFAFLQSRFGNQYVSPGLLAGLFAVGLFLLPAPRDFGNHAPTLFPFDVPAWSLFFELIVNAFHALLLRRRGILVIAMLCIASGTVLQYSIMQKGSINLGASRSDLLSGFARIACSYLIGMLLMVVWKKRRPAFQCPAIIPTLLLLGILAIPASRYIAVRFDVLLIVTLLPLVIVLSASAQVPKAFTGTARVLGAASYSVYILHAPLAVFFEQVWKRVFHHAIEMDAPWSGILCLVAVLLLSMAVDRFIDIPARSFLRKRTSKPVERPSGVLEPSLT
jgi:peptidoglycan/LPS O-acetylase OafA/YrhL